MRRVTMLLVFGLGLLGGAGGCTLFTPHRPLTVRVRDMESHEPVADALVHARTTHFYLAPMYEMQQPLLDPLPPGGSKATTGPDGKAQLEVVVDHPVQLIVIASGYVPVRLNLEDTVATIPSTWIDPESAVPLTPGEQRVEILFEWADTDS